MNILSIRQPYSSLAVTGVKDIENRKWRTRKRGTILIHASRTPDELSDEEISSRFGVKIDPALRSLVGGIIGSVEIVDCVTSHSSKWFNGPFGFVLANARVLPFVPMRGPQGWGIARPELLSSLGLEQPRLTS